MDTYTHGNDEAVLAAHRHRTAQNSAAYLLGHLKSGMDLLDIGCGEGTITVDLAKLVAPGKVVGIDVAPEVVERARQLPDLPSNVSFKVGDVYRLDFPDGSLDVVHGHQVMQHLSNPVMALKEMARVTRPGGLIALRDGDYGGAFWYPPSKGWESWQANYQEVARCGGSELDAGRRLMAWAHAAGLAEVEVSGSVWTYPGLMPAKDWAESWAKRITATRFADLAKNLGKADADALEHTARDLVDWAGHPDAFFAMPAGEVIIHLPG